MASEFPGGERARDDDLVFARQESPQGAPRSWRPPLWWLPAGGSALALGVVAGLIVTPDLGEPEHRPAAVMAPGASETSRVEAPSAVYVSAVAPDPAYATGAYLTADAAAVTDALRAAQADYARGGAGLVAATSRVCFTQLSGRDVAALDRCLAYDLYGAALTRRAGAPDADDWFAGRRERGAQAARMALGAGADAAAHVVDVQHIALSAWDLHGGASPPPPAYRTTVVYDAATGAATDATAITAVAAPSHSVEPDPAVLSDVSPEPQVLRVAERARPSFDCRYARTPSERLVCGHEVLADADRDLDAAYEAAVVRTGDRAGLRAEQDAWLAERERAAQYGADGVLDAYDQRVAELQSY